jgi:hypothetical protein
MLQAFCSIVCDALKLLPLGAPAARYALYLLY